MFLNQKNEMVKYDMKTLHQELVAMTRHYFRTEALTSEGEGVRMEYLTSGRNRFIGTRQPYSSLHLEPSYGLVAAQDYARQNNMIALIYERYREAFLADNDVTAEFMRNSEMLAPYVSDPKSLSTGWPNSAGQRILCAVDLHSLLLIVMFSTML